MNIEKKYKNRWRERKLNMEVSNMLDEPRQIIKMIGIRKTKFFRNVMRHNMFIINIMKGKINGKRERETNLGNVKKLLSLTSYEAVADLGFCFGGRPNIFYINKGKVGKMG